MKIENLKMSFDNFRWPINLNFLTRASRFFNYLFIKVIIFIPSNKLDISSRAWERILLLHASTYRQHGVRPSVLQRMAAQLLSSATSEPKKGHKRPAVRSIFHVVGRFEAKTNRQFTVFLFHRFGQFKWHLDRTYGQIKRSSCLG